MLTLEEIQKANVEALILGQPEPQMDWREFWTVRRDSFRETARMWRNIAHDAQLAGDNDVVIHAHMSALENENWARSAEAHLK